MSKMPFVKPRFVRKPYKPITAGLNSYLALELWKMSGPKNCAGDALGRLVALFGPPDIDEGEATFTLRDAETKLTFQVALSRENGALFAFSTNFKARPLVPVCGQALRDRLDAATPVECSSFFHESGPEKTRIRFHCGVRNGSAFIERA